MSDREIFKLDCNGCGHTLELPAIDGATNCPNCGANLEIEWGGERRRLEAETRPQ